MTTEEFARQMRREIVQMLARAGSGHPGGSLSATDIIALLYNEELRIDPNNPHDPERDRFVLTKGHAAPALYAALALRGYFPLEELSTLRSMGSRLQGHPDMNKLPGVDMSTGSLGQGLSAACGMALAAKQDGRAYRVYTVSGDGECQEGQFWEAAMFAAHYKLDNLIAFIDNNHLQIDGEVSRVMNPEPFVAKLRSFGWQVANVDGHNLEEMRNALTVAKNLRGRPTMLVADTVKGKGVSFMENKAEWHGSAPNADQVAQALAELEG